MSGFRKHGRKLTKCAVRLSHSDMGDMVAETRDISESGVFVNCKSLPNSIAVGDELQACVYTEANIVTRTILKVVRMTDDGIALAY